MAHFQDVTHRTRSKTSYGVPESPSTGLVPSLQQVLKTEYDLEQGSSQGESVLSLVAIGLDPGGG